MLSKEDVLKCFEEINNRLADQNKFGELIIAGGASMVLVYNARSTTKDVDAVFEPKDDLRKIIRSVGTENNFEDDWLNDGVKGFFTDKMTASLYKDYGNLIVRSIDPECLLAMKLTSARYDTNDIDDAIVLMKHLNIKNIESVYNIIEKYAHPNQLTAKAKFFTMIIHEKYIQDTEKNPERTKKSLVGKLESNKQKIAEQSENPNQNNDRHKRKNKDEI